MQLLSGGKDMTETVQEKILCPVCGGPVKVDQEDKVNRCEYCASPVLGPSQSRDCVNHPGVLAKEVCHVCGDLVCEDCFQKRVGEYGGKLLTIVNCDKPACVAESEWAKPLNEEYQKLANMDWADRIDNRILRVTGLGAIVMMIFELIFFIGVMYFQFLTPWSMHEVSLNLGGFTLGPVIMIPVTILLFSILGNLLSAILLQSALQVYVHERQMGAGITLLVILVIEVAHLMFRGLFFNLLTLPVTFFLPIMIGAFLFGTILVFFGSLAAIYIGNKKRKQLKRVREQLNLSIRSEIDGLSQSS
jgi:DNA-directed RNA polymerase subunit RPC12/RpoP